MIKVDENDPVGEVDPAFAFRDVQIRKGEDVKKYYDLEGEIGRGKFGIVYKCKDKETKLVLAAKFVSIAKRQDRKNVEREVEIMKNLRHPRLIQLYDAFENDSTMCVVLEMIEGGELFERVIDDDFVLTEKACTVFMRQICEGVGFIHSNNIIHLDLKPENILCLTKTGNRIKIIDFGLARKFDPDKKLQVLFGTPEFVAPEVVNFDQISCATDMWSVGVICYVLLSGLSPFMGESDIETMSNVTLGKYDFDDDAFDDISAQAKDFIGKLLVKNKEKRLTAEEALNHPWLYRKIPPPPPSLDTSKDNLKSYMESASNIESNMNNKLSNRKSMLNAIQILADSEKQFAGEKKHFLNGGKNVEIIEEIPTVKPARPETLNVSSESSTGLLNSLNSTFSPKNDETPLIGQLPEKSAQLELNQPTVKTETPSLKRESPLPDTLASLVPINAQICEPIIAQIKSEQTPINIQTTGEVQNTTVIKNLIKNPTPFESVNKDTTTVENSNENMTENLIKNTTPVENLSKNTSPVENLIKSTTPVGNLIKNTTPVENLIKNTTPVDNLIKHTTPVENLIKNTTPVENSIKNTTPVDNLIEHTTPVENLIKNTTPVENLIKNTTPDDNSIKNTTPVDNSIKNTTPVENLIKNTTPVDNLIKNTTPVDNLVKNTTTTVESLVKNTSHLENTVTNTTPVENVIKNTAPGESLIKNTVPVENLIKNTTPDENLIKSTTPVDKLIENTTPVEKLIKNTPPVESFIKNTTPVENLIKNTISVENLNKNTTVENVSNYSSVENVSKKMTSVERTSSTSTSTSGENTTIKIPSSIINSIPVKNSAFIEKASFVDTRRTEETLAKTEKFEMPDIERRLSSLQDRLTKLESEHLLQTAQKVKENEKCVGQSKEESVTKRDAISKSFETTETASATKESIIKTRQNMDILLPKLNESLANMIVEMPPPKVHESFKKVPSPTLPKSEKLAQDFPCNIPTPLSLLETSRTSMPTPLSLLNKVADESEKNEKLSDGMKRNSITEMLQSSLGPNLAQKLNLGLFEEQSLRKDTQQSKSPDRTNLGTLNQNPHPKILGITLGHSYEESTSKSSFSSQSSSIKYNKSFEETEIKKQKIRKESKFESKESDAESVMFKQHLKSIPPWFSETKSLSSKSNSFTSEVHESTESTSWSNQINQLSARLMEISRQSDENQDQPSQSGQNPLTLLLSKNNATNRRPKMKFSMMNRDVPIGSPPNEGGREFYLNRPLFVDDSRPTPSPSSTHEIKSEFQNRQNSYQETVLKIVSSEKKENTLLSETSTKKVSCINANSKT